MKRLRYLLVLILLLAVCGLPFYEPRSANASGMQPKPISQVDFSFPFEEGSEWKITSGGGYNNSSTPINGNHVGYANNAFDFILANGDSAGEPVLAPEDAYYWRRQTTVPNCIDLVVAEYSSTEYLYVELCHLSYTDQFNVRGSPFNQLFIPKGTILGWVQANPMCGDDDPCGPPHIHMAAYHAVHDRTYPNGQPLPFATTANYDLALNRFNFYDDSSANQWHGYDGFYSGYPNPTPNVCSGNAYDVVLWEDVDYEGQCVGFNGNDLSTTYNNTSGPEISSIWLSESWTSSHDLTFYSDYDLGGQYGFALTSIPDLTEYGDGWWNDKIKSLHNHSYGSSWLQEFSISDNPPLETNVHVVYTIESDFDSFRICFNGGNCQENTSGELNYTWPTYYETPGSYKITAEYRRDSDNQNWANADIVEYAYYLNPNRSTYTSCGAGVNGAKLVSGSDCLVVTNNVADMAPVGWADRSNLSITAQGYDVLAYDSSDFRGPPKLVRDGQTVNVGGNVSGIELRDPLPDPYVPSVPLGTDGNTIVYLPMDEGSGSSVYSQVGTLTGSLVGNYSHVAGRFGNAVNIVKNPDGSGINFGAQNFGSSLTFEMFVKFDSLTENVNLATQLGGGPNTGTSKWLMGLVNNRFRVWACWTNGCHEGFSLDTVQTNRWYYLMFTYDGNTTAKFYVDSVLQTTLNMDGTMPGGSTTFEIAKGENNSSCNCTIDDFRISNIVRVPVGPPPSTPVPPPTSTAVPTFTPTATPVPVYWDGGVVANGSFETLTSGWADSWTKDSGDVGVDTSGQGNSGVNTLHFAPTSSNTHAFAGLVDVNPARTYQLSQYVKTTSGTGEFGFYIDEYDSGSNWISGQWLGAASIDSTGTVTFAYTPSSGSVAKAGIQYYMSANSTFNAYVDSVRFEENLISNGSFEVLDGSFADNWAKDASSVSIDQSESGNDGANSLYFGYNASNTHAFAAGVPVSSSTTYMLSQYVKASSGSGEFGFYIDEYDSSWNWISGQWLGAKYGATDETVSFSYTPSSGNVAYAAIQYYISGGTSFDVYVDRVKLVVSQ